MTDQVQKTDQVQDRADKALAFLVETDELAAKLK